MKSIDIKVEKTKLTAKDFPKGTVLPKRPLVPYVCFCTEYFKENKRGADEEQKAFVSIMGGKWKGLT